MAKHFYMSYRSVLDYLSTLPNAEKPVAICLVDPVKKLVNTYSLVTSSVRDFVKHIYTCCNCKKLLIVSVSGLAWATTEKYIGFAKKSCSFTIVLYTKSIPRKYVNTCDLAIFVE
jgi:hypothetical protein